MRTLAVVLVTIGAIILSLAISFGVSALAIYVASLIFHFTFKWIYVIGLMIAITILRSIFKSNSND